MRRRAWTMWMMCWALAGCGSAHPTPAASTTCDPATDTEDCRYTLDSRQARMRCDAAGNWVTVDVCRADQACQVGWVDLQRNQRIAQCADLADAGHASSDADGPASGDTVAGSDAVAGKDTVADGSAAKDTADGGAAKGTADGGETATTCPVDCPVDIPGKACVQAACPGLANTCFAAPLCVDVWSKLYACVQKCGGGQSCIASCQSSGGDARAWALAACALDNCLSGTCGDGTCGSGETTATCPKDCKSATTGSCAGSCGTKSAESECFCDPACGKKGDCCDDYAKVCLPGG